MATMPRERSTVVACACGAIRAAAARTPSNTGCGAVCMRTADDVANRSANATQFRCNQARIPRPGPIQQFRETGDPATLRRPVPILAVVALARSAEDLAGK